MTLKNCFIFISVTAVIMTILVLYFGMSTNQNTSPERHQLEDIHLFENKDCIAGCWQGLRPGVTIIEELESFLEITTVFSVDATIESGNNYGIEYYLRYDNSGARFYFRDNTLTEIYFTGLSNIRLSTILEEVGEPEYINIIYLGEDPNGNIEGGIELYYPNQGYFFWIPDNNVERLSEKKVSICYSASSRISSLSIYKPSAIQDILVSDFPIFPNITNYNYMERLQPWEDYGCVITESIE